MSHSLDQLYNTRGPSRLALTFDTDWAPDFVLADLLARLAERGLAATLFATNPSEVLTAAARQPGVEIGLHPNFSPGSSHGATPDEVLATLLGWFPGALGMRSHSLVQSSPILRALEKHGLRYESNLLLYDCPGLQAFSSFYGVTRIPYLWSDASHLCDGRDFRFPFTPLETPGLKVLDLHPMLLYLNASSLDSYEAAKARCRDLPALTPAQLDPLVESGDGVDRLFDALCDWMRAADVATYTLRELDACFRAEQGEAGGRWHVLRGFDT